MIPNCPSTYERTGTTSRPWVPGVSGPLGISANSAQRCNGLGSGPLSPTIHLVRPSAQEIIESDGSRPCGLVQTIGSSSCLGNLGASSNLALGTARSNSSTTRGTLQSVAASAWLIASALSGPDSQRSFGSNRSIARRAFSRGRRPPAWRSGSSPCNLLGSLVEILCEAHLQPSHRRNSRH
jgi:hypothetical protein